MFPTNHPFMTSQTVHRTGNVNSSSTSVVWFQNYTNIYCLNINHGWLQMRSSFNFQLNVSSEFLCYLLSGGDLLQTSPQRTHTLWSYIMWHPISLNPAYTHNQFSLQQVAIFNTRQSVNLQNTWNQPKHEDKHRSRSGGRRERAGVPQRPGLGLRSHAYGWVSGIYSKSMSDNQTVHWMSSHINSSF